MKLGSKTKHNNISTVVSRRSCNSDNDMMMVIYDIIGDFLGVLEF